MRVLIFGATGMVGQGVLRECLLAQDVEQVLCVGRTSLKHPDAKLVEVVTKNLHDLSSVEEKLRGFDACFFCLGVSSAGMTEAQYRHLTYDLTISAAQTLVRLNPGMSFVYVSGAGTDSTEQGRSMWARVKGATENGLMKMPFRAAYMFRPGVILPMDGIKSKTRVYRIFYDILGPLLRPIRGFVPSMATTRSIGQAMLAVARHGSGGKIVEAAAINALAEGKSSGA